MTQQARRSVARDARKEHTAAQEIAELLAALHDRVETQESVLRYRTVRRGRRDTAVPEFVIHRGVAPGLLEQLGVVQAAAATVPVQIRRWERADGDTCKGLCWHGRWVHVRTEQRTVPGIVRPGSALPGGSPGWDADGALSPLTGGGKPEAAEPIGDGWHTAAEIAAGLADLRRELADDGHTGSLVDVALADEDTGRRIAARLRSLVSRARVAAGYDAPIVPLRDMYCVYCGGQLRVRADASSAVWCVGRITVHGPAAAGDPWPVTYPCGARWERWSWVNLLEQATA